MTEAYTENIMGRFAMLDECKEISGFGRNARSGREWKSGVARDRGKVDSVVLNNVELTAFILPKDLNKVVNERVVIVNDKYIF